MNQARVCVLVAASCLFVPVAHAQSPGWQYTILMSGSGVGTGWYV
jgi:hypothetical protein